MTSQSNFAQPPGIGVWLVSLFAPAGQAESILGDLHEEYSDLASKSGPALARRWYWRQVVTTIAHLAIGGFRGAPWTTVGTVAVGFFLIGLGFKLYGHAFEAVVDRWVYGYLSGLGDQPSLDISAYLFWVTRTMLVGRVLVAMLVGSIVALAAKEREMTATTALGLARWVFGVAGCLLMVATTGDYEFLFLWALPTVFADSLPIMVGGAIVRMRRLAAAARPSV